MISRSVAQIATASMRTSTSARLGTGTGFFAGLSSPALPSTQAFIVSGIGKSGLVFTPGPEYMGTLLAAKIPKSFAALITAFRCRAKPENRPSLQIKERDDLADQLALLGELFRRLIRTER